MRKVTLAVIAILMACPVALAAQTDTATEQGAPEKTICKKSRVTGSLTRVKRTCKTESQWNDEAERARKSVDQIQSNGYRRVGETLDESGHSKSFGIP